MEHNFTEKIKEILEKHFFKYSGRILKESELVQYLNIKTKSANKGSKSRGSFANLYAVYVLVEDYVKKGYIINRRYKDYEGAIFTDLLKRQRKLPFGQKLQNHALKHRMNEEFKKYFPECEFIPILRDPRTNRYWFNENLLLVKLDSKKVNISKAILEIIDAYVNAKKSAFEKFIQFCENADKLSESDLVSFVKSLIEPNIDARIFEIVSYCVLKYFYFNQVIYWGFSQRELQKENLKIFKTGRTNANDGGIDFVMKPLGRFFQVTETVDVNKYFLDIDKIEKYPITFVVKSNDDIETIRNKIKAQAEHQYSIQAIVKRYMECIEEIINIPNLLRKFEVAIKQGYLKGILEEIIKQSKVEFNYDEEDYDVEEYINGELS